MARDDSIHLHAHLRISGDDLDGELLRPDGRSVAFSGWLGLLGAVESARAAAGKEEQAICDEEG